MVQDIHKKSNVSPVFQKGKKEGANSYRVVSLTTILGNAMEQLILETISRHLKDKMVIRNSQHGITKGKLCLTNLIVSIVRWLAWWMRGESWILFTSTLVKLLTLSPVTFSLTQ